MSTVHRNAGIIGETKFCTQCAEYLLEKNWEVAHIISEDPFVINWARNNSLSIGPVWQLGSIKEKNFYLFSIINTYIIPKSLLENKNVLLAINYDSLLSKYIGTNSATRALHHLKIVTN